MGFLFARPKKTNGWLAISFQGEGVCAVSIRRYGVVKPQVRLAALFPAQPSLARAPLDKLNKELQAATYRCGTLLAAGEYQLLAVEAPAVAPDELRTAVRWRLKEMLDFPADQATIDVLEIPPDSQAPTRGNAMFAVAARNSVIESRQNLFLGAGLDLSVIDIPEMAQRNLSALMEPEGRGVAMLSFNADGGLLTVSYKAELYLSRRIDVTLAQLLDGDADKKAICYDKITLELQRSLDHFDRQFHFISVSKLILAPSGNVGLHEFLSANLYTAVEQLDLADLLDLSLVPELATVGAQQRYFLTVGAALREQADAP